MKKTIQNLNNSYNQIKNKIEKYSIWKFSKILVSIWLSFTTIKIIYLKSWMLFIYSEDVIFNILIFTFILSIIYYFIIDKIIKLINSI